MKDESRCTFFINNLMPYIINEKVCILLDLLSYVYHDARFGKHRACKLALIRGIVWRAARANEP